MPGCVPLLDNDSAAIEVELTDDSEDVVVARRLFNKDNDGDIEDDNIDRVDCEDLLPLFIKLFDWLADDDNEDKVEVNKVEEEVLVTEVRMVVVVGNDWLIPSDCNGKDNNVDDNNVLVLLLCN